MRGGVTDDVGVVAVGAHGSHPDDPGVAVLEDRDGCGQARGHGLDAGVRRAPAEPRSDRVRCAPTRASWRWHAKGRGAPGLGSLRAHGCLVCPLGRLVGATLVGGGDVGERGKSGTTCSQPGGVTP